jgi:hypothetical protein
MVASLPLMNTVIGPLANLAITPDERLLFFRNNIKALGNLPPKHQIKRCPFGHRRGKRGIFL